MSESTEETPQFEGTWYCITCRQPATIKKVVKRRIIDEEGAEYDDGYELYGSCPKEHHTIFRIQSGSIVYMTYEEQKELAKIFAINLLDKTSASTVEGDIYTQHVIASMSSVSGLPGTECQKIIKQGITEGWAKRTQEEEHVEEKIALGDNFVTELELEPDPEEE